MVMPIEKEKKLKYVLEDRLAQKFDDLQVSREDRQPELFDEVAKSIEVLLRAVPDAYNDLMEEKETLNNDLYEEVNKIEQEAANAQDEIYRQAILQNKGFTAQWDYREVYEEIIIGVMQKHGLIPMMRSSRSMLESMPDIPNMVPVEPEVPEELPVQQQQPPPQQPIQPPPQQPVVPQQTPSQLERKPRLLSGLKRRKRESTFEVK